MTEFSTLKKLQKNFSSLKMLRVAILKGAAEQFLSQPLKGEGVDRALICRFGKQALAREGA